MALYDLGKIILPREQILAIAPGGKAPDSRKAAAIDPYRRIIERIPRRWEKCWNQLVESLCRGGVGLADIDAIGRVGKLEIVHCGSAKNLAQLGYGNAPWLGPRLLNIGSPGICPPATIAHRGRTKIP